MDAPLFGMECEYAIAGMNSKGPMSRDHLANQIIRVARRRLPHLPDTCSPSGMFLQNGARLYVDCGSHPEMASPECTTPAGLVQYVKAGDRLMEGLVQEVQAHAGPGTEVICSRCNVDYKSGTTWGCHESYRHHADPAILPDQLMSHLVTRILYSGAGGFNPLTGGLEFCLAPRLMYIQQAISGESTGNRGIFHTKNETLACEGNNRLHVLCGETLCSETAILLKVGTTALLVALVEKGIRPGDGLQLASPIEALRIVALDKGCTQELRLSAGGAASALEIQRRLLRLVEHNLKVLPIWAGEICGLWGSVLDRLGGAPESVSTLLDWAIKLRLVRDRAERSAVNWERSIFLNSLVVRLDAALANAGVHGADVPLSVLLGPQNPIPKEMAQLAGELTAEGLTWDDFERFLKLRDEFYQIDARFGQLGPRGIFGELDRGGVLDHRVESVGDVVAAMSQPPEAGRAKLRGEAVRRLYKQSQARCSWTAVFSPDGRTLDLRDPFASEEVWREPLAMAAGAGDAPLPPVTAL